MEKIIYYCSLAFKTIRWHQQIIDENTIPTKPVNTISYLSMYMKVYKLYMHGLLILVSIVLIPITSVDTTILIKVRNTLKFICLATNIMPLIKKKWFNKKHLEINYLL